MKRILYVLVLTAVAAAQEPRVATSKKFPMPVHVTAVRMEKSMDVRTTHTGVLTGGDHLWHVMTCEIGGKSYGLRGHMLHTGWYAAKETKRGFEIQFSEDGKLKSKPYRIIEESE